MSFATELKIAVQIAQAMTYLHSAKSPMVHLNIKPVNILVCKDIGHFSKVPQNRHYQQLLHVKTLSYHVILIQRFVSRVNIP